MFERFDMGFYTGLVTVVLWDHFVIEGEANTIVVLVLLIVVNLVMRILNRAINGGKRESK